MSRPKSSEQGIRANVWIHPRHVKLWKEIENKTGFLNLALDDAIGIMTFAILKKEDPEKFHRPIDDQKIEDVVPGFNEEFPLDELTAKRLGKTKWHKNSPPAPEAW